MKSSGRWCALWAAGFVSVAALADDWRSGGDSQEQSQKARQRWQGEQPLQSVRDLSGSQSDFQRQQQMLRQQQEMMQDMSSGGSMEPTGWVAAAIDYDNDGNFDAFEYLYSYDLERARESSKQHAAGSGIAAQEYARTQFGSRLAEFSEDHPQNQARIRGRIEDLFAVRVPGMPGRCVIASVRTQGGGTEDVNLGPTCQVQELDIQKGDQISVTGARCMINDNPVVLAERVSAQGQSVRVDHFKSCNRQWHSGRVMSTGMMYFRGQDEPHVVGQVQLDNGKVKLASFGPQSELNLDLRPGDTVSLQARLGRINNRPALIVQQIESDGQTIALRGNTRRNLNTTNQFRTANFD